MERASKEWARLAIAASPAAVLLVATPPNSVKSLRAAFDKMMNDQAVKAEAAQQKIELISMHGDDSSRLIDELHAFDPALIAEVAKAMKPE